MFLVPCLPAVVCVQSPGSGPMCRYRITCCFAQSTQAPFLSGRPQLTVDVSDTSSTLTSSKSDEFDEHNIWNPMLRLLCHAHVGVPLEQLFDEEDLENIALSCHFALDLECDKSETRCAQ